MLTLACQSQKNHDLSLAVLPGELEIVFVSREPICGRRSLWCDESEVGDFKM